MAALLNCSYMEPHEYHGWTVGEQSATGTKYFVCEGVGSATQKEEQ